MTQSVVVGKGEVNMETFKEVSLGFALLNAMGDR